MSIPISFNASIDLPDGRRIYVSIDVPQDHPAGLAWEYVGEHSEIAQMAAASALRLMQRGDVSRAKQREELNQAIAEKFGKAPF